MKRFLDKIANVTSAALRELLAHIVDYAGTFPPASLSLRDAFNHYARERRGPDAWLLGRLVVSSGSLDELESLLPASDGDEYPLSVLVGGDAAPQLARVEEFNVRHTGRARVASVEFSPAPASQIATLMDHVDSTVEAFFETPIDGDLHQRLDAVAGAGAAAKVRTGGTVSSAVPSAESVADFLHACAQRGLSFKATAGLHHAIRNCYPLTYEPNSSTAVMYGFLNVTVAAALAKTGAGRTEIGDALIEPSAARLLAALPQDVVGARQFFKSFGSCSFREPADELAELKVGATTI